MTEVVERPKLLRTLCILSCIWISLNLVSVSMGIVQGPASEESIEFRKEETAKSIEKLEETNMTDWVETFEQLDRYYDDVQANYYLSRIINVFTLIVGAIGVLFIWKGKKIGFHLYIIYSLLSAFESYFYVSTENVSTFLLIGSLSLSGLFIFLYSKNLKWLV